MIEPNTHGDRRHMVEWKRSRRERQVAQRERQNGWPWRRVAWRSRSGAVRRVAQVTVLVALASAAPTSMTVAAAQVRTAPPSTQEEEALEIIAARGELAGADLWPNYDVSAIPLAISDGARTWLYGHPHPPEEFAPHPSAPGVWVAEGQHPAVRGNSSAPIAGVETATLLMETLDDFPTLTDRVGAAVHEGFHVYQRQAHPDWGPDGMGFENPVTDARLLALRRVETDLLREAVAASDSTEAARLAAAALNVRSTRFAELPPSIVRFERGIELMEGTAQHVQVTATGSLAGLMSLPEDGFAPEELHLRSYAAGLALTRLLERLWPSWKRAVEHGRVETLDAALGRALERAPCEAAPWQDRYEDALSRARSDIARLVTRRDSLRQALSDRAGWKVTLLAPSTAVMGLQGLDPMNLTQLGDDELLHHRWVRVGHATGTAEVMGREALTTGVDGEAFARGFTRLLVPGLPQRPEVHHDGDTVMLTAPGFEARFEDARVSVRDDHVVIRLAEPAAANPEAHRTGPLR
ncbi:MAG: hypothetical protein R6U63_08185 [Longimicrobiales bacterium]